MNFPTRAAKLLQHRPLPCSYLTGVPGCLEGAMGLQHLSPEQIRTHIDHMEVNGVNAMVIQPDGIPYEGLEVTQTPALTSSLVFVCPGILPRGTSLGQSRRKCLAYERLAHNWCYPHALPPKADGQYAASRTALAIGPFDKPQVSSPRLRPDQRCWAHSHPHPHGA